MMRFHQIAAREQPSPATSPWAAMKPFDGKAASVGNGVMVALVVNARGTVVALYTARQTHQPEPDTGPHG